MTDEQRKHDKKKKENKRIFAVKGMLTDPNVTEYSFKCQFLFISRREVGWSSSEGQPSVYFTSLGIKTTTLVHECGVMDVSVLYHIREAVVVHCTL